MKQPAKSKKGFEAARLGVFAITGPLLTHLNCGIRADSYGSPPAWVKPGLFLHISSKVFGTRQLSVQLAAVVGPQ